MNNVITPETAIQPVVATGVNNKVQTTPIMTVVQSLTYNTVAYITSNNVDNKKIQMMNPTGTKLTGLPVIFNSSATVTTTDTATHKMHSSSGLPP